MGCGAGQVGFFGACFLSLAFHGSFSLPPVRQRLCFLPGLVPAQLPRKAAEARLHLPQGHGVLGRARGKPEEISGQEEGAGAKTFPTAKPPQVYP